MRLHLLDYLARDAVLRDGGQARSWRRFRLVSHGFWLHGVPRPIVRCRLFGHRPVVDGYDSQYSTSARWVACDRCGARGNPQGSLDPAVYPLGVRYRGPWGAPLPELPDEDDPGYEEAWKALKTSPGPRPGEDPRFRLPGPIRRRGEDLVGTIGGQLVIGDGYGGLGVEFKVGNPGSEHILAARIGFGKLGTLYLHTEDGWGRWLQRRCNDHSYESRVTGFDIGLDEVRWRIWSKRDDTSGEPWWRHGELHLRPLDRLLGRKRYEYTDIPGCIKVGRIVRLPEADYLVELTLQRQTLGRRRGPKRRSWCVDWNAPLGLPTKGPDRGRTYGSGVDVSAASVRAGTWPAEAAAQIALRVAQWRTSSGWDPVNTCKPDPEVIAV